MKITRTSLKEFRADFVETVEELEKKYGVKINLGNISFTDNDFSGKINVVNINEGDEGKDSRTVVIENDFKTNFIRFGLKESDLGSKFLLNGKTYTIVGSKARSHKYPIIGSDGKKTFKFTVGAVKNNLID